jgi:hypothetical protein
MAWREWSRQRAPRSSSPLSQSSTSSSSEAGETFEFHKQTVKQLCNKSQLTSLIKKASNGEHIALVSTANKFGLEGLSCADLPSAFDSDEEED